MKITVLVNAKRQVIGTAMAHSPEAGIGVGVLPGKGQAVHVLEVPEDLARLPADQLHEKLEKYLPRKGKKSESD